MGINKRSLIKWLTDKKDRALWDAQDEKNRLLAEHSKNILAQLGIKELADKMQGHMAKAAKEWDDWKQREDVKESVDFTCYSSIDPDYMFNNWTGAEGQAFSTIVDRILGVSADKLKPVAAEQDFIIKKIHANYTGVIRVAEGMQTGKEAATYLRSLGFDLSELERQSSPTTSLAIQIDPTYLFLNKDKEKAA